MKRLLVLWLFVTGPVYATSWAWMSAEQYLDSASLIAVVDVGTVHEAHTPEGIQVSSAKAEIVKTVFWQFTESELPKSIVIYDVAPNAVVDADGVAPNSHWNFTSGRFFVILKMQGDMKFRPFDRLSLQPMKQANDKVMWPVAPDGTEETALTSIEAQLKAILEKRDRKK